MRNNNPLNIRIGNTWLGEVPTATDSDFEQFVSMKYGVRAAFCILRRYIRKYNRNTVERIIRAWAPATENDTERYITAVCSQMKLERNVPILYEDEETMCALVKAMAFVENGMTIDDEIIVQGYKIA